MNHLQSELTTFREPTPMISTNSRAELYLNIIKGLNKRREITSWMVQYLADPAKYDIVFQENWLQTRKIAKKAFADVYKSSSEFLDKDSVYYLSANSFFYRFIEQRYLKYITEFPCDKKMKQRWYKFKIHFASLKYAKTPDSANYVMQFLTDLKKKLTARNTSARESLQDDLIIKALKLFKKDFKFTSLSFCAIHGTRSEYFQDKITNTDYFETTVSVFKLFKNVIFYNYKARADFKWVMHAIQKRLSRITTEDPKLISRIYETANFIKNQLIDIDYILEEVNDAILSDDGIKGISTIYPKILRAYLNIAKRPKYAFKSCLHKQAILNIKEIMLDTAIQFNKKTIKSITNKTISIQDIRFKILVINNPKDFGLSSFNVNLKGNDQPADPYNAYGIALSNELDKQENHIQKMRSDLQNYEKMQQINALFETFIEDRITALNQTARTIFQWLRATRQEFVDELISIAVQENQPPAKKDPLPAVKVHDQIPIEHKAVALNQLIAGLEQKNKESNSPQFMAIRRAQMSLQDLLFFYRARQITPLVKEFRDDKIYSEIVLHSFYAIEQTASYLLLAQRKAPSFTIKGMMAELGQKHLINNSIISRIFGANAWVVDPYEQMEIWQESSKYDENVVIPEILVDLNKLANDETVGDLDAKISSIFEDTIDVVTKILSPISVLDPSIAIEHPSLQINIVHKSNSLPVGHALLFWEHLLGQFVRTNPYDAQHPVTKHLRNCIRSLELFEASYYELMFLIPDAPQIQTLTRSALFWFGLVMENYLLARVEATEEMNWSDGFSDVLRKVAPQISEEDVEFLNNLRQTDNLDHLGTEAVIDKFINLIEKACSILNNLKAVAK